MANGDAPPPAPDVPHFDTRFVVQTPDGSIATQVLRTDRPISTDELTAHLANQGSTFVGYPETPPPAPPAEAAPAEFHPTAAQRAAGIFLPERSFKSQIPSIGGAVTGSTIGGGLGAMTGPAAPVMIPAGRIIGGGLGGAGGEALEIGGEKLFGLEPAEPGSALNRIVNAGIRSSGFEAAAAPIQYGVNVIKGAAQPITEAAAALKPVLTGAAAKVAKAGVEAADGSIRNVNLALSSVENLTKHAWTPEAQETLLGTWWQRQAGKAPEKIAEAWDQLGEAGQQAFGELRGHMQTVIDTIQSGLPIPDVKRLLLGGGGGVASWFGHPAAAVTALPAAQQAVEETVPYVGGKMLMTPSGAGFLAGLPRVGQVVAPRMSLPLIGEVPVPLAAAAGQSYVARPGGWPSATTFNWTGGD
jgi:hypothetical protein